VAAPSVPAVVARSFDHPDHRRVRVASRVRGRALGDRIDRLVLGLPWARLCPGPDANPDVLFVDAGDTAARWSGTHAVVAVLGRPDVALLDATVRTGVRGLLLADDPVEDFRRSIRDVAGGGAWISPRLAAQLLARIPRVATDPVAVPDSLTARERQALRLLADGRENAEIAVTMSVTVSAVKYHVSNILRKFGCRDRTQLLAHLNRVGLSPAQL